MATRAPAYEAAPLDVLLASVPSLPRALLSRLTARMIERLDEMEFDELVELQPFSLHVTEKGKPFIRNICMAFDARLWESQPEAQLFSQTV